MIRFGDLREKISAIDRISVCIRETLEYENYRFIKDVPSRYDDYFVCGIGMIDSEFPADDSECTTMRKCIEIVLTVNPYLSGMPDV